MVNNKSYYIYILLITSLIIRALLGYFLEFGNDEVYYWTYTRSMEWSYFDHPGLFAWLSKLFSFAYENELAYRLSSILIETCCIFLFYRTALLLFSYKISFLLSLLFIGSIYNSVISGIFLMPDAPLNLFWLFTIFFLIKWIISEKDNYLLVIGLTIGLALASKYQAVYLWIGVGIYILFKSPKTLKTWQFYAGIFISALGLIPILVWNYNHNWISFNFHNSRVGFFEKGLTVEYFFSEFFGQLFYNNPFNIFILILTLIFIFKHKYWHQKLIFLFLALGLPLILTTLFLSFFNRTFPHWSSPAYFSLLLLSGYFLQVKYSYFWVPRAAVIFLCTILLLGIIEINNGYIMNLKAVSQPVEKKGKHDFTQDTYGWKQLGGKFRSYKDTTSFKANTIISHKWFPASHLYYYVAKPNGFSFYAMGDTIDIHQYIWLNKAHSAFTKNQKVYFITASNNYKNPTEIYSHLFIIDTIPDTLYITRRQDTIRQHYIYKLIYR